MHMISLCVALSKNNVIGLHNTLPWYLPADLKHFKELTTGQTVVMGRKTLESIIDRIGHPLPQRRNVVVTRQDSLPYDGVEIIHDIAHIRNLAQHVFVIGGADIYRHTLPMADELHVTEVHATIAGDTYFPDIDPREWREVSHEAHAKDDRNEYDYDFVVYRRR